MRFYCPKCDLKYRIDDDKLAAHPNGQLRCRACHTVFSVQAAIKLASARKADGRAPVDGAENLSLPPPKPAPVAWKSTAPAASHPPGKGVVTMPLLDVTAKPRVEQTRQINLKPPGATKPGLAPANRVLLGGSKGARPGAASLLAAKGLRGAGERGSLPAANFSSRPTPNEPQHPVQVLGRGSVDKFPAVTEERTHPIVPPLPRSVRGPSSTQALREDEPASSSVPLASAPAPLEPQPASSSVPLASAPAPLQPQQPNQPEEFNEDLDAELSLIESVPPLTPRMALETPVEQETVETRWGALNGRADFDMSEPEPVALELLNGPTEDVSGHISHGYGQTSEAQREVYPRLTPAEPEALMVRSGVPLGVAIVVALVCGVAGLAGGFALGTQSEQRSAGRLVMASHERATERPSEPPPPPPPEVDNHPEPERSAERAQEPRVGSSAASAKSGMAGSDAKGVASEALALSGLGGGTVGPEGVRAAPAAGLSGTGERAIQSTVQRNQATVRRSCWQAALSRNGGEGSVSARVTVTATIAANGRVTSVEHSGDPQGFPGLGSCVATRVKAWKFPRTATGTTAQIPFVFAAQ